MLAEGADRLEVKSDELGARLVSADADLLCQLLLGLVANAAQVSPEGSPIVVGARVTGGDVELAVEDRGPGVPAELRAKIFEPFFTTRPGGTGLGLAVARQIATAHDARLDVEDRPGGGARFVLRIAEVSS
jgi:two-component system sensor histidine kinase FlrB